MRRQLRVVGSRSMAVLLAGASAMWALWVPAAGAAAATFGDPDDVSLRLDLKSVSHSNDGKTIVYTAETYDAFADSAAAFKWRIDLNGDGVFEVVAFAEWENGLVSGVEAGGGDVQLAPAKVSRPAPNAIRLTFPASAFAGKATYRYVVVAETDLNGDGEMQPGEFDQAPDSGVYQHVLSEAAAPAPVADAPAPQPAQAADAAPPAAAGAPTAGQAGAAAPAGSPAVAGKKAAAGPAPAGRAAVAADPGLRALPRTGPAKTAGLAATGLVLAAAGLWLTSCARRREA